MLLYDEVALLRGAVGSAIATPTDLVKVRQQAEGATKQKRYRNTAAAFRHIFRNGGVRALYVGIGPTVQRAAILTATQVSTLAIRDIVAMHYKLILHGFSYHPLFAG